MIAKTGRLGSLDPIDDAELEEAAGGFLWAPAVILVRAAPLAVRAWNASRLAAPVAAPHVAAFAPGTSAGTGFERTYIKVIDPVVDGALDALGTHQAGVASVAAMAKYALPR